MTDLVTPSPSGYALDSAWHAERERLESITGLYDPRSLRLCESLGLAPGWCCLDVGAGTGSLAAQLAARVAPDGRVVALDVDTRFLAPLAACGLDVVRADVTEDPLPESAFDLVHARLVLEHLPRRDEVLSSMAAAVRPGGWLLVEDFDWATAGLVDPPSPVHDRVAEACAQAFTRHGYDPFYGRRLPRRLHDAGLVDVATEAQSLQVQADRRRGLPQWELLVDQLGPAMIAGGLLVEADLEQFHALWHDGRTVAFAPLMVSCWGRRPV
jgi:SAM-dependent methyltransferase